MTDQDFVDLFCDREVPLRMVNDTLALPIESDAAKVLVLLGSPGVGVSAALRMASIAAKSAGWRTSIASLSEQRTLDLVLRTWVTDLKKAGVKLGSFDKAMRRAEALLGRRADRDHALLKTLGTVAKEGTMVAPGLILGGPVGIAAGAGVKAAFEVAKLLPGIRAQSIDDLHIVESLTASFLDDLQHLGRGHRVLLVLDDCDRLGSGTSWLAELVSGLPVKVRIVLGAHKLMLHGPEWPRSRYVNIKVDPISDEAIMIDLLGRYMSRIDLDVPRDDAFFPTLGRVARGLPAMAVFLIEALRLEIEAGVSPSEQAIEAVALRQFVERVIAGVSQGLQEALLVMACLRVVDPGALRTLCISTDDAGNLDSFAEIGRLQFVRTTQRGLSIEPVVRQLFADFWAAADPDRWHALHDSAASLFARRSDRDLPGADEWAMERIYHLLHGAHPGQAIPVLIDQCESLVGRREISKLEAQILDVQSYDSRTAVADVADYYTSRSAHLRGALDDAEAGYCRLLDRGPAVPARLRSYAHSDLAAIYARPERLSEDGGIERATDSVTSCLQEKPAIDAKTVLVWQHRARIADFMCKWDESIMAFSREHEWATQHGRVLLAASAKLALADRYAILGRWVDADRERFEADRLTGDVTAQSICGLLHVLWVFGLTGRTREGLERSSRLLANRDVLSVDLQAFWMRERAYHLGLAGAYEESQQAFAEANGIFTDLGKQFGASLAYTLGFQGEVALKEGRVEEARSLLERSMALKVQLKDDPGLPELFCSLGELALVESDYGAARSHFDNASEVGRRTGRGYYMARAQVGIVRMYHALGRYSAAEARARKVLPDLAASGYRDLACQVSLVLACIALRRARGAAGDVLLRAVAGRFMQAAMEAVNFNLALIRAAIIGDLWHYDDIALVPACGTAGAAGERIMELFGELWETSGGSSIEDRMRARNDHPASSSFRTRDAVR